MLLYTIFFAVAFICSFLQSFNVLNKVHASVLICVNISIILTNASWEPMIICPTRSLRGKSVFKDLLNMQIS